MPAVADATPASLLESQANPVEHVGQAKAILEQAMARFGDVIHNEAITRRELFSKMLVDQKRDIDSECGYPPTNQLYGHYKQFYDREGLSTRIVNIYPEESWKLDPLIYEREDMNEGEETEFELAWKELNERHNILSYLQRIDKLSGIGHYGVLLVGINDGKELSQPVEGAERAFLADLLGEETPEVTVKYKVTFLRCFTDDLAPVAEYEADETNPRFGMPKSYNLTFQDNRNPSTTSSSGQPLGLKKNVHWTRVLHVCDNRTTSEIAGVPRLQDVFNRMYDLKKLFGGSAEMFWKGGFPGYSFEIPPEYAGQVEIDQDALREEIEGFMNSLQRYMSFVGITVKSLAPQVADPTPHIEGQLEYISIAKSVPKRVLMGSEQGELASSQDKSTWNDRLQERQKKYLTPWMIRPFIRMLVCLGVLPNPVKILVDFPDLNAPSKDEIAKTGLTITQAMAQYISGGLQQLMPELEWLTSVMGYPEDEAEAIIESAEQYLEDNPDKFTDPLEEPTAEHLKAQTELVKKQVKAPLPKPGGQGNGKKK